MKMLDQDQLRSIVRERYTAVAKGDQGTTPASKGGCCSAPIASIDALRMGYTAAQAQAVPEGANMGLGCGNPVAIASIKPGDTVLDLGSGGGFDAFLAAPYAGPTGRVIGVDMTPEMISKARSNSVKGGFGNVEFRLGEIEYLPVADCSVDLIISNCVINLSPNKPQVFSEAMRVLKPGGRLVVSDVVATAVLPEAEKASMDSYTCCVAGASLVEDLHRMLSQAGFKHIQIEPKDHSREFIRDWLPGSNVADYVVSAVIEAQKE